jgi:ketosteroid isomerase-like protein
MTGKTAAEIEAEVRRELTEVLDEYLAAILRGDVEAAANFWHSDAWMLQPGVNVRGKEQRAFVVEALSGLGITAFQIDFLDLFVHGEAAYTIFQFSITSEVEGQEPQDLLFNSFVRFVKEDGVWKPHREVVGPRDAPPEG